MKKDCYNNLIKIKTLRKILLLYIHTRRIVDHFMTIQLQTYWFILAITNDFLLFHTKNGLQYVLEDCA